VKALLSWLRAADPHAVYLAAAADLADLERRLRLLERGSRAPLFVTFNH
jgi:hypothetical protein